MIAVEYIDHMGGDLDHVNCARTTFNKWKDEYGPDDKRLIDFLTRNEHSSPSRHNVVKVRCHAPIFLARQLMKHVVGFNSWSEISRRYVDAAPEIFWPDAWRARPDKSIKQGSGDALGREHQLWNDEDYGDAVAACEYAYRQMLERGTAPEQARFVLPQAMMTTWVWTGSLPAYFHLWRLRHDSHAQVEAQIFADQIEQAVSHVAPDSWAAMKAKSENTTLMRNSSDWVKWAKSHLQPVDPELASEFRQAMDKIESLTKSS